MQNEKITHNITSVLHNARCAGVMNMLCCGTSEHDWSSVAGLCSTYQELIPSFGLHPWRIRERSSRWLNNLEIFLAARKSAAVGEIGLDHAITERNDTIQNDVFKAQLELAMKLNRPVSIHCRKAWDSLLKDLDESGRLPCGFAIHSYSGSPDLIPQLTENGAFFSFSGSVTRSGNKKGHLSAAAVPLERLLIETDSPDLPPVREDGNPVTVNEPANLAHVLKAVAEIRGMTQEALAEVAWKNSEQLFGPRHFHT